MPKFKRLFVQLDQMADKTYAILRGTLLVSCTMLLCSLALFLTSGGATIRGFEAYMTAQELFSLSAVILLMGSIAAIVAEESARKTKG